MHRACEFIQIFPSIQFCLSLIIIIMLCSYVCTIGEIIGTTTCITSFNTASCVPPSQVSNYQENGVYNYY